MTAARTSSRRPRRLLLPLALALSLPRSASAQSHVAWANAQSHAGPGGRALMAFAQQSLSQTSGGSLTDVLWMFGGISVAQPLNYSAQLWGYTSSTGEWELVPAAASGPPPLIGASMCAIGHQLWMYGGQNFEATATATLWNFDTAARSWSISTMPGATPQARAFHTLTCAGGEIFLFGGHDASGTALLSSLYVVSGMHTTPASPSWTVPPVSGAVPTKRKSHTLTHSNGRLYLFGGAGEGGEKLNDVYKLDIATHAWSALSTTGEQPTGREGHTAVVLAERLYVFGGADAHGKLNDVRILDLASHRWSHPREGRVRLPNPRANPRACA